MPDVNKLMENPKRVIWRDRRRTVFGLPWTTTRYSLTAEKFILERGFFRHHLDEVRLYRVKDISLDRNLRERVMGLGTVSVVSSDKSAPQFEIARIRNSRAFTELLSDLVEENCRRVYARELLERRRDGQEYM